MNAISNIYHLALIILKAMGVLKGQSRLSKKLLEGSTDPYFSLLTYRTTPLPWCGYSPAEILMGRKLQAHLPLTVEKLIPDWSSTKEFCKLDADFKQKILINVIEHAHSVLFPTTMKFGSHQVINLLLKRSVTHLAHLVHMTLM